MRSVRPPFPLSLSICLCCALLLAAFLLSPSNPALTRLTSVLCVLDGEQT